MAPTLLLTGQPGVGKTTIVRTVIERLPGGVGGFFTEEIRDGAAGQRTGFRLVALDGATRQTGTLATLAAVSVGKLNGSEPQRVGRYRVDLADLDRIGVAALRQAVDRPDVVLVVIDEIGKMELLSPGFRRAVEAVLAGAKPVLATVMARPQPWIDEIKARPGVKVVEVTLVNRRRVVDEVLGWLRAVRVDAVA